jgi:benzoate membrane transport protein
MMASWVWAISIGAAVSGIALSWWLRVPVITAWSAPGTALLITLFPDLPLQEAVGAYITAAALILIVGLTGGIDWMMRHIPRSVCCGMMASILFQFGARAFKAVEAMPLPTLCMVAGYLLARRFWPRYHLVMVLALGIALTAGLGGVEWSALRLEWTRPVFIAPAWSWASTLSLAVPLAVVSLAGLVPAGHGHLAQCWLHDAGAAGSGGHRCGIAAHGAVWRHYHRAGSHHCGAVHGPRGP